MLDQLLHPSALLLLTLTMVAVFAACGPGDCQRLCVEDFWLSANLSDVRTELDNGADINGKNLEGWAPLPLAIVYDVNPAMIELLIDRGADINAKGVQSQTPIQWAVMSASRGSNGETTTAMLINKGADVNVTMEPSGITPLHLAIGHDLEFSLITLMLDKGADVTARTEGGETPLHFAAYSSTPSIIQVLLSRGVDIYARNDAGHTPCQSAIEAGRYFEVGHLLC